MRDKLLAVFTLAGIKVIKVWDIKNGYGGEEADWLLVNTELGMITLGWRRRVIAIDWEETGIRCTVPDEVTKGPFNVHAWSYVKAVEYLSRVVKHKEANKKES